VCAGVLVAAGSGVALASDAGVEENRVTFQDTRGEEPDGPDIAGVTVSNGDAGLITFRIGIPSHPVLTDDLRLRVWVDSDHNTATGIGGPASTSGWDYWILWDRQSGLADPNLFHCSASGCINDVPQRTLDFSYASGPRFTILDAELGNTKRFRFYVESVSGIVQDPATRMRDYKNARWDFAPELGRSWSYNVWLAPKRLLVRDFSTAPVTPRAGATLAVRLTASESPSGAVLTRGRVSCTAAIGGKAVETRSQGFVGKRATCVYAIPSDAAGKAIRGSIAVRFKGKTVTRTFARRIAG
jgi:hypothetical protein